MLFSFSAPIWFYPKPVDFRKQVDGLVMLVSDQLQMNPTSGQLYVFRNRSSNKLKLLWWDRNGFWLCYRRLEKDCLTLPSINDHVMELSRDQLGWLLSGLNFLEHKQFSEIKVSNFY
jgi:transposase